MASGTASLERLSDEIKQAQYREAAETFCRLVGPNALVPFPVSECTGYTDRRSPDSVSGRRIGFVSADALRETEEN